MTTDPNIPEIFVTRRQFLAAAAAIGASSYISWPAWAAEPHSFKQGDFDISVITDGELTLPANVLAPEAPAEERKALLESIGQTSEQITFPTNLTLIRSGSDLILVDNGSGNKFQPTAGKLVENLKAAGIEPDSVTKLVFSHAHPDHIWGTLKDDNTLVFPNAAYYVSAAEWDFWMDPELLSKMPAEMGDFVKGAQRDLDAVKDKITMLKAGDDIVTGVRALDTAGHTPGHVSLEIAGGAGLIVVGDAIPNEVLYLAHPEWKFAFDTDADLAVKNRQALLDRAATDKIKLIGYHWTYPGVGMAERKDGAFQFAAAS